MSGSTNESVLYKKFKQFLNEFEEFKPVLDQNESALYKKAKQFLNEFEEFIKNVLDQNDRANQIIKLVDDLYLNKDIKETFSPLEDDEKNLSQCYEKL